MNTLILLGCQDGSKNPRSVAYHSDYSEITKNILSLRGYDRCISIFKQYDPKDPQWQFLPEYYTSPFTEIHDIDFFNKISIQNKSIVVVKEHSLFANNEHLRTILHQSSRICVAGFLLVWEIIPVIQEIIFQEKWEKPIDIYNDCLGEVEPSLKKIGTQYLLSLGLEIK